MRVLICLAGMVCLRCGQKLFKVDRQLTPATTPAAQDTAALHIMCAVSSHYLASRSLSRDLVRVTARTTETASGRRSPTDASSLARSHSRVLSRDTARDKQGVRVLSFPLEVIV